MTQADRLLLALERSPLGLTSLDIVQELHIINTTGRVSDLRARGHRIDCVRDERGYFVFHLIPPGQTSLGL